MIEEPPILTVHRRTVRPAAAQVAAFAGVPTGFVVDAMEGRGALSADIAPLTGIAEPGVHAAGPALTADNPPGDILATLAALSRIEDGDILVAAFAGHRGCAAAGDRLAGMLRNAGGAGFVTDGPMRDFAGIRAVGLPCWCAGLTPASPFATGPGTVGAPVRIGGQVIASGDVIVADVDGVVVVPHAEIDAVIARLGRVRAAEEALDAEVREGLRIPPAIADLAASDRTRLVD